MGHGVRQTASRHLTRDLTVRTIKHLMVQLCAAVLGRYNKRFTPEDIITTQRRMCYVEDYKGYVEQESAHAQPVAVYASKKIVYAAKGSTSKACATQPIIFLHA
uniref:Uncharacterized protein n=1 Tax=Oryza sativa subsp. japonica TaxID=39947 RepID=Q2R0L7_ORYSJ|nr:hypothetical protein LOC_Os11g42150 [Oryza sativa Japonica Group]